MCTACVRSTACTRQTELFWLRAGASYPGTGSDGGGAKLAKKLGRTIVPLKPSLIPLESDYPYVDDLQGLSLRNVQATLLADGVKLGSEFGEMLFTHFGVSGPIVLSLSNLAADALAAGKDVELEVDLKPALSEEKLDAAHSARFCALQP